MKKNIFEKSFWVILFAVICNMLWGSAYPAIKLGYEAFGITDSTPQKLSFAGIRFITAGIMVLLVSIPIRKKAPIPAKKSLPIIFITAVVYTFLQYIFFYVGLSNTTGTNGSIFNSTSTFIAVITAHFVYKDDKLTLKKIIGSAIGFIGVLFATMSGGTFAFSVTGEGFIVIAALCFVIGSMISKLATKSSDSMIVTGYNLLAGGILLTICGLLSGGCFNTVTLTGIWVLIYLAFLSACAFTIWTMLLKYNPVGKISIYNFIIPIFGTLLCALFLHEDIMKWEYLVSLAMVCTGIVIVNSSQTKTK